MDNEKLAELLFPEIDKDPEYYENKYAPRELNDGAMVTRLGPSPTGFIHLGNLYGAFVDERLAHKSGGTFYLRIEDTDDKRYVEGAVETIITSLKFFGIEFDEGAGMDGETGDYGPYTQSERKEIYQAYAKKLVKEGKAYPCFMTETEIEAIRKAQESAKVTPGIYGDYAMCRDLTFEEIEKSVADGKSYVLRLRSDGKPFEYYAKLKAGYRAANGIADDAKDVEYPPEMKPPKIMVKDGIRKKIVMPVNFQDVVILKKNGMPTYHFAHVIDDHLMRTTHVVRGEEWLSSLPTHIELFEKLGLTPPTYCHTAQLMKLDDEGNKRKLSKREDPELSLDFYRKEGYHPEAVREYLMTVLNSNFEEWRKENPEAGIDEFDFTLEKMSSSGALFDLNKLNDVSKDVLLRIPAEELFDFLKAWSKEYAPEFREVFYDKDYLVKILDLGRHDRKPRKDLIYGRQIMDFVSYFFDDMFQIEAGIPEEVQTSDVVEILERYLASYSDTDDQEGWFNKIRGIAGDMGYAERPKDYKKDPDSYKGHVGHISTLIRVAIVGRTDSPDLWEIQRIMGKDMVEARINSYIVSFQNFYE